MLSCDNNSELSPDSTAQFDENIALFLESVEIIPKGRVKTTNSKFAKILILKLHDVKYQTLKSYILDGEEFVDNGTSNDLIVNDRVYTSVISNDFDIKFDLTQNISFKSDNFKYFAKQLNQKTKGGEFGCKIRHTRQGKSLLGFSCSANIGCFELYDCSFKLTW